MKFRLTDAIPVVLIVLTIAAIGYFVTPAQTIGDIEPAAGTAQPAPAGMAQYNARCMVGDQSRVSGTVTVPDSQNPANMDSVDLKTPEGGIYQIQGQGACEYAPF